MSVGTTSEPLPRAKRLEVSEEKVARELAALLPEEASARKLLKPKGFLRPPGDVPRRYPVA